jgi:radical SAM family RiPP maturation amino acid epimerase
VSTVSSDSEVQALFLGEGRPDPAYVREVAHAKRFCERFHGDHRFREAILVDPQAALRQAGIEGCAEDYRPLFEPVAWQSHLADPGSSPRPVRRVLAFNAEKASWRNGLRLQSKVAHSGLQAWRSRQIQRCHGQLPNGNADFILHSPVSFELSLGCSVGCWFCGISAGRLAKVWTYLEHREEWRGVLQALAPLLGEAGRLGFCYWGTDPFDNPDYEKFCLDHFEILGAFPHTTTALAHRDLERTRYLLRLSQQHGCKLNRFSVLSLSILDQIHQAFSAEELLFVDLALQNSQSLGAKTRAGRVLAKAQLAERLLAEESAQADSSPKTLPTSRAATIACVSGFQFNLVERRVRLISPCPADQRWPDGFRIHAELHYQDPLDLQEKLMQLTAPERLGQPLRSSDTIRLRSDVRLELSDSGLSLHSPFRSVSLARDRHPYVAELAAQIPLSPNLGQLALHLEQESAVPLERVFHVIHQLQALGLLEDDPKLVPA